MGYTVKPGSYWFPLTLRVGGVSEHHEFNFSSNGENFSFIDINADDADNYSIVYGTSSAVTTVFAKGSYAEKKEGWVKDAYRSIYVEVEQAVTEATYMTLFDSALGAYFSQVTHIDFTGPVTLATQGKFCDRNIEVAGSSFRGVNALAVDESGNWTNVVITGNVPNGLFRDSFAFIRRAEIIDAESIGTYAFYQCSGLAELILPEGLKTIGDSAFTSGCVVPNLILPSSIETIGKSAFHNCKSIVSANLPEGLKVLGANAFYNCGLEGVVGIPASLESIGGDAYYYNKNITAVIWKAISAILSSGNGPFRGCTGITEFVIADNVRTVPDGLCNGLTGLKSITLPASVESIGKQAFYGASALKTVFIERTDGIVTLANTNAFSSTLMTSKTGFIYVPDVLDDGTDGVEAYKTATNWATYADVIKPRSAYVGG